jgi:hypothetical protein
MTVVNDIRRFLVQRRLWPVAILLVAAAAAVPFLLAEEPAPPPAAPSAAVKSADSALVAQPLVAPAGDGDRAGRRKVLGSRKNPFKPNATPTPTPTPESGPAAGTQSQGAASPKSGSSTGGIPSSRGTTTAPVAPVVTTPKAKPKKYELFELTVRFGPGSETQPPRKDVKRLQALPSNDDPVLIYLGVLDDKKTAVFMVDSGVVAQGDGTCKPSRSTCETLQIKEGETEFLDIAPDDGQTEEESAGAGAQYQLDVIKIRKTTTRNATKAKRSIARVSKSGRKILRARIAGDGPLRYRFDQSSGRLHKLSGKAYRAVVAKAARTARGGF